MDARAGAAGGGMYGDGGSSGGNIDPMREIIVLAACGANELLPQVRTGSMWGTPKSSPGRLRTTLHMPRCNQIALEPASFAVTPLTLLFQNPDLPADVFTACLTTPIKVALRWFCSRSLLRHDGLTKELIDRCAPQVETNQLRLQPTNSWPARAPLASCVVQGHQLPAKQHRLVDPHRIRHPASLPYSLAQL